MEFSVFTDGFKFQVCREFGGVLRNVSTVSNEPQNIN